LQAEPQFIIVLDMKRDSVYRWTAADIPDQTGRVAVVTGANAGLGYETARELARKGASVLLGCRNAEKAERAADTLRAENPAARLEVSRLDLADLASVRAFAQRLAGAHDRVDLLVNNAGIMAVPRGLTADGFELHLGTNHLGHFALTGLLLPLLASGARVVTLSSMGHRPGRIAFDDLMGERRYSRWSAYFQSKLANLLFTYELQRRELGVVAVAAHPGVSSTELGKGQPVQRVLLKAFDRLSQPAAMGALPTLRAATAPDVRGGDYYGPGGPGELRGFPVLVRSSEAARDEGTARRLWDVSVDLTGVDPPVGSGMRETRL
jgi:NAD(P)-dependent dehydrogenase (short-subunit alcohol dehydrogenase family)